MRWSKSSPRFAAVPSLAVACAMLAATAPAQLAGSRADAPTMVTYRRTPAEYQVTTFGPESVPSPAYAFLAAKVLPVAGEPFDDGVILTRDSKILAIGPRADVEIPADFEVVDLGARDLWVCPGYVDLHCHVASVSSDINDTLHPTNPEMRTLDLVTMDHENLRLALAGGITTVMYIPGSGGNVGGFGTLTKTAGRSPEEALLRFPGCVKIAQGNNPTRRAGDVGSTHMGMNANLRAALERGKRYHDAWEAWERGDAEKPELRPDLEYMRGLFRHEYPVCVHSQYFQVFQQTLRQLRREYDLWTVIVHGTFDAYRLCEETVEAGVPICNGPRQFHLNPATGTFTGIADSWYRGGNHGWREPARGVGVDGVAINTDSPVVAQEELQLQCAMAIRLGLPDEVGVRALTINPARFAGIDERIGTLEPGKDADFCFWTGDPLDPRHRVEMTVVNGRIVYRCDGSRPRF